MRGLGYRVVDVLVERIAGLGDEPVWRGASWAELDARLAEPAPEDGRPFQGLLDRLLADVLPFMYSTDHPRFFAYIPGCPTWPGVLGDLIAGGFNVFQGTWPAGAGANVVELVVLDWFRSWIGYPEEASGLLVSGGSEANLTALACARAARFDERFDDAVVYLSGQTHSSVERAARVLGFQADRIRTIAVDDGYRMRTDAFAAAIEDDERAGLRPFLVAANAGATNTGAIDPLLELAALCRARGLWLHVDGAYGGFAALTERGRAWLAGIELADSVTLDPHKWLYQPWGTGSLLVREGRLLEEAFHVMPDYLQDAQARGREVSFADRGIQLTRPARALKIWLSIQFFGLAAFRAAIDRALDLAALAERRIESSTSLELLSPAALGIVCFRRALPGAGEEEHERANAALVRALAESGTGFVSSTRLDGRYALRLCVENHTSRPEDVEQVLAWLESAPVPG